MARKRHQKFRLPFAYAWSDKLLKLVSFAGLSWSSASELKEKKQSVSKNIQTCLIYKKHHQDL